MHNYKTKSVKVPLTIGEITHEVEVDSFGEGKIPLLILGHAEVYRDLIKRNLAGHALEEKLQVFAPKTYWNVDSPLSHLPVQDITAGGLKSLASHIEEIRQGLAEQDLLKDSGGKIGLYSHSGFSAIAFQYAVSFPDQVLYILAEGAVPYFTEKWSIKKQIFYDGNFKRESDLNNARNVALNAVEFAPEKSAVSSEAMQDFNKFISEYNKMTPALFFEYEKDGGPKDNREAIWGNNVLNMAMMRAFFNEVMSGYDCKALIAKVTCPVDLLLGAYDWAVPHYLWTDSPAQKGRIGFFNERTPVDYRVCMKSGHWPMLLEQPQDCFDHILKFFMDNSLTQSTAPVLK
jgi:pimeloyl-ACP methyl ester carboxylesterase